MDAAYHEPLQQEGEEEQEEAEEEDVEGAGVADTTASAARGPCSRPHRWASASGALVLLAATGSLMWLGHRGDRAAATGEAVGLHISLEPVQATPEFVDPEWNDAAPMEEAACVGPDHRIHGQCDTPQCNKPGNAYFECFQNTCRHAIKDPNCTSNHRGYPGMQNSTWCYEGTKVSFCHSASYRAWNEPVAAKEAACTDMNGLGADGQCDTRECNKAGNSFFMCQDQRCMHGVVDPDCRNGSRSYDGMQEGTWCWEGSKASFCRSWKGGGRSLVPEGS